MELKGRPTRNSRFRRFCGALLALTVGLLLTLALLEGALRLLPVRDNFGDDSPVTAEQPIKHFKRDTTLTYSKGFNFALANSIRTNNHGFFNNQDYVPCGTDRPLSPLLAVIGDSYVEAAMVPYAQTLHGRLATRLEERGRVYSFGASGAALSQYLAYARFARDTFCPEAMAFVIVGNDFDESLAKYAQVPGFHHFFPDSSGELRLELVEFHPTHATWLHELGARYNLGQSALVRYLRSNLPLLRAQWEQWRRGETPEAFVGQTAATADPQRMADSKAAVDAFFRLLPEMSGLPRERCLLLVDGIRPQLYDPEELAGTQGSYFQEMREYFLRRCQESGHECIDLQPLFTARHAATGERFEYREDGHWNPQGHAVAAQAALDSRVLTRSFPPPR